MTDDTPAHPTRPHHVLVQVTLRGYIKVDAADADDARRLVHDKGAGLDDSLLPGQGWDVEDWQVVQAWPQDGAGG